jgi:hypothetical protein
MRQLLLRYKIKPLKEVKEIKIFYSKLCGAIA